MAERVIVTGAAGFIGVRLTAELLRRGASVIALDDFSVGAPERLDALEAGDALTVAELDLRDPERTRASVAGRGATAAVHLAALHHIPSCEARPAETLARNVVGTQHLIDALEAEGVNRLVFASTAAVYAPSDAAHAESDPLEPVDVYGLSKLAGEWLVHRFEAGAPERSATALRLFNVYGPGETNAHVIPEILDQLTRGDVLSLGNVETTRDYVYVDDVAAAAAELALAGEVPQLLNVGTGAGATAAELVRRIAALTGRELRVELDRERLRRVDRPHLAADTGALGAALPELQPRGLDEGLAELLRAENLLP